MIEDWPELPPGCTILMMAHGPPKSAAERVRAQYWRERDGLKPHKIDVPPEAFRQQYLRSSHCRFRRYPLPVKGSFSSCAALALAGALCVRQQTHTAGTPRSAVTMRTALPLSTFPGSWLLGAHLPNSASHRGTVLRSWKGIFQFGNLMTRGCTFACVIRKPIRLGTSVSSVSLRHRARSGAGCQLALFQRGLGMRQRP